MLRDIKLKSTDVIIVYPAPVKGIFKTSGNLDKVFNGGLH